MYQLPFTGNICTDLELNTNTKSGTPRLNFKIAVNEGERGTDSEKTHFIPFTAFGSLAENTAESLKKGDRVTVIGRLNTYDREVQIDGEDKNLTMIGFTAKQIGPDLTWASAKVNKNAKRTRSDDASYPAEEEEAPAKKAPAKKAPAKKAAEPEDDDDF